MVSKLANKEQLFMKIKQKKVKYQRLILGAILMLFLLSSSLVFAANSTESAQPVENNEATSTIDNIKKVIQEKKTELGTVGANLRSKKATLARVTRVSQETLTVNNYAGSKIIPLNEEVLIQKKGKAIKIEEVVIDNWVAIFQELVEDKIKIKKIVVYETDFAPKNKVISIGSIVELGKNDLKFAPRSGEAAQNFSFNKTTRFQNYLGEEAKLTDFYQDLQCLIVAFADKNGNYQVSTIRALSSFEK